MVIPAHSLSPLKGALILLFVVYWLQGCGGDMPAYTGIEPVSEYTSSQIPYDTYGRPNNNLGCYEVSDAQLTIYTWDHGIVDGDIVTIIVNGNEVISNYSLQGPDYKASVTVTLPNKGYNYVLLYAHNEGDISPNTATMDLVSTVGTTNLTLESDLYSNGAADIVLTTGTTRCY